MKEAPFGSSFALNRTISSEDPTLISGALKVQVGERYRLLRWPYVGVNIDETKFTFSSQIRRWILVLKTPEAWNLGRPPPSRALEDRLVDLQNTHARLQCEL